MYSTYKTLKSEVTKAYATYNLPKKERGRADVPAKALRSMEDFVPEFYSSADGLMVMMDDAYEEAGRRMYFLAKGLLPKIAESKMKVHPSSLSEGIFTISWQRGEDVDGVSPVGCVVSYDTVSNRHKKMLRFVRKYGLNINVQPIREGVDPESHIMYLAYKTGEGDTEYATLSIYEEDLILAMDDDSVIEKYDPMSSFSCMPLSDEEKKYQSVLMKLILKVMCYMSAFPEAVRDGLPDDIKERSVRDRYLGLPDSMKLNFPSGSSRCSPSFHIRDVYFRSYPIRKDGTRRKGVVRVSACGVGGDADPAVIEALNSKR